MVLWQDTGKTTFTAEARRNRFLAGKIKPLFLWWQVIMKQKAASLKIREVISMSTCNYPR